MKIMQTGFLSLLVCGIIITAFLLPRAEAEICSQWVAKAVSVQGDVQARRSDQTRWQLVKYNDTYCIGDMIRVMERSRADIVLSNDAIIHLDQKTTITFSKPEKEKTILINLLKGIAHFFSRIPQGFKVATPFVNAAVEGTEFLVKVESDKAFVSIFEGRVIATNEAGSVTLRRGESVVAKKGCAPELHVIIRLQDAVQWALYYPPVIYYRPADFQDRTQSDWQTMMKKSVELYMKGDLTGAFERIAKAPKNIRDPRFYTYRASLLLSVGRVDEAKIDIEKALKLSPDNSHALALQSIIAVIQNEKDRALNLAQKAVQADPKSSAAYIALSYAQQARFDLQGALYSLKEAIKVEPGNALAWARLSELFQSFGELDESLNAAEKAIALNPDIARTHTVLGFSYLTQVKIKESKAAFEKAIGLDQADPFPHLGLGLAMIREGKLREGGQEIEIAVSLDPNNSLLRSYLGKAFYEEKSDKKAEAQFAMAKELDPKDPTFFFYDAIKKQTENRPVEALHDMQKAIELNDDRAVYRSRLLLDSDLAARSASLARIYTDLGFQELALVEGWKSVNTDPADFSGHRFLADSYSALPRHEIARVSELLQSQLLQPINITPVQPHLAESNLSILNGAGPADLSFNEFNPLFNRNRFALQMSGIAGGNNTYGDELVLAGVQGKVSFSMGQFHYETDGFRKNNDQKQDIYNIFAQVELSPRTSVQAEFRSADIEKGDIELRFFPNDFSTNLRDKEQMSSVRLGFHHTFSQNSDVISSLVYQSEEFHLHDSPFPMVTFDNKTDADSYNAELQHLFRSERFNLISGVGYCTINRNLINTIEDRALLPIKLSEATEDDIRHTNLYSYSNINYLKNVTLTMGASADFFEGSLENRDQFNPKLGLTWSLIPSTTLRAAVFRVLKRTLINNQTLEPTQVAGFNQFFDDVEATDSWTYGIAVDRKLSQYIYLGLEYFRRNLEVPFNFIPFPPAAPIPEVKRADWKERLGRAYLYWTPHSWLAVNMEYQYERFDRDRQAAFHIKNVTTHRFPVGINFYHPSGFIAQLKATYFDQEGRFQPQGSDPDIFLSGEDRFWIIDALIGYRLPKRLGLIRVGVNNLFNESFKYQDTDPANPTIQPKRLIFAKFTLAF